MSRPESITLPLDRRLRQEILWARERVYRFGQPTPMERLILPGAEPQPEIWVKREDLSAIKSYKWRGASNRIACLAPHEKDRGVVTASAGNHAQGVALAVRALNVRARIFMPRSTPRVKQDAVRHHGGSWVEIVLAGDSYDEAVAAAREDERNRRAVYIHAYDDIQVMAGQGTMADEVVLSSHGPFDAAFLQVGGGGMIAGVAAWLKIYWPAIEVVAIEGVDQASLQAARVAGRPVPLDHLDIFCDGTAVRQVGGLPFEATLETVGRMVTVTNAEVSRAIRVLWESLRCISEPSGALGLAAVMRERQRLAGRRVLIVITGANLDFLQLGLIAQSEGAANLASRTLRVRLAERPGTMLELLDTCFTGLNIADFQYGKSDRNEAWPAFTVTAEHVAELDALPARLALHGYTWEDLTGATDIAFRAIPLHSDLLTCPAFLRLDFYERPGALHDFLDHAIRGRASLCYFNYRQSGERIGRALIGLDFDSEEARHTFLEALPAHGEGYRSCELVETAAAGRLARC